MKKLCIWLEEVSYSWVEKSLDIVVSSMFSMYDVDRTQNSILHIPCYCWFPSPVFHFSQKRTWHNEHIFHSLGEVLFLSLVYIFRVQEHHQILTSWWVTPLKWREVIWREYSLWSYYFSNQYRTTTHFTYIDKKDYYYIRHSC